MGPLGDVDVIAHGFASAMTPQLSVVKQALQNFALAFVQWREGMCFPEAPLEDGLVPRGAVDLRYGSYAPISEANHRPSACAWPDPFRRIDNSYTPGDNPYISVVYALMGKANA